MNIINLSENSIHTYKNIFLIYKCLTCQIDKLFLIFKILFQFFDLTRRGIHITHNLTCATMNWAGQKYLIFFEILVL